VAKTIQIRDDLYVRLTSVKRAGESFSDTIQRLLNERKDPGALLRLRPPRPGFDLDEVRQRMREADLEKWRSLHG